MPRDIEQQQRRALAVERQDSPPVACEDAVRRLDPTVHLETRGDGIGLGREIGADRRHHGGLLGQALPGRARGVGLGDERPAHRLGVRADRAQLRRSGGDDDLLAVALTSDLTQLVAQLVERAQHPAAHEHVRTADQHEQHRPGDEQGEGHPTGDAGQPVDRDVPIRDRGVLHRLGGRRDVEVGRMHHQPDDDQRDQGDHGEQSHAGAQARAAAGVHAGHRSDHGDAEGGPTTSR